MFFKKSSLFITFGLILTVSAFMLTGYNNMVQFHAEKTSENLFKSLSAITASTEAETDYTENSDIQMPVTAVDGYDFIGTLQIPSLKVNLPVMSEWNYKKLRVSPCRYTGSVYQNNLVICAHNYKNHFGKIATLKAGDKLHFTDMYGNVFRFKVCDIETVNPENAQHMTDGNWDLTLFTCTVGGTSRVTVRCVREVTDNFQS